MNMKQRQTSESELVEAHQELWTISKQIAEYHGRGALDATSQLRLKMRERLYERQKEKIRELQGQVNGLAPKAAPANVAPPAARRKKRPICSVEQSEGGMMELLKKMKMTTAEDDDEEVEDL
jgi:cob(I)alamin adenosyltransferase